MATFLEIVQDVVREFGTISGLPAPATTVGQTGRLDRFVRWTQDAYRILQNRREDWRWLRHEFSGTLLPGIGSYDSAALGATRFASWHPHLDKCDHWSIYLTTDGQATEGYLSGMEWENFRSQCRFGGPATQTGTPAYFSINPQDEVEVWPIPDDTYTIRGEYVKGPQVLSADADIPEMPTKHHDAIKWQALIQMAIFDESTEQMPYFLRALNPHLKALELKQLPSITLRNPLA